ncbi:MAG TPA: phage portal protein [Jatrophihabitans sp.]|nr:phage portal protein [Jatrophihabitans sp.]
MKPSSVIELVRDQLWPAYESERDRLRVVDKWYRWDHPHHHTPRNATPELKKLIELSRTPWLGLVVNVISQTMVADGYRSPDEKANASAWRTWQSNKFDARQIPIHKAALAYGYAFATALPGTAEDGTPAAAMRGVSPLAMQAVYADPAEDDWPMFALRVITQPRGKVALRVYDETSVYFLAGDNGGPFEFIEERRHDAGVCPVVRYANQLDLDGRTPGEVEPFISIAARINKTDYDRMLTQHFSSWKVRYAAGLAKPSDADEAAAEKLRLRQDDLLIAEDPDTRFGTLDATPLDGFIAAHATDIETLAAVTQTPTNALTGQMVNLSAEALASARAQLDQKVNERKLAFGESHAQLLRLAAHLEGDDAAATDVASRITWQDMSIRSMAQAVDALGKAAQMLGIPVQALWPMIPGVTRSDVEEWRKLAAQGDPLATLGTLLERQAAGANAAPPAAA